MKFYIVIKHNYKESSEILGLFKHKKDAEALMYKYHFYNNIEILTKKLEE